MQPADCPACGGALSAPFRVVSSELSLREQAYALRRCVHCGSAVTVGAAPVDAHESGAYRPGAPRLHAPARPVLEAFDRRRLALLEPYVPPPASLLDIGAGRGRFVAAARAAGYDARGVEPSDRGVTAARELGVPVVQSGIDAFDAGLEL